MASHSRRRRRGGGSNPSGRGRYIRDGGVATLSVAEPTEAAVRFWDGPREVGPLVVGEGLELPYVVDTEFSRYFRLKAKTYDAVGNVVDPAVSFAKRRLDKYPSSLDVVVEPSGPLAGVVTIQIRASRGDGQAGAMIWWAGIDGERFFSEYGGVPAGGSVVKQLQIDTRKWPNGKRHLKVTAMPDGPMPAAEAWMTSLDIELEFQNGAVPMALMAPYYQLCVNGAVTRSVAPVMLRCDGSTAAPVGPVVVTSSNVAVATVAGTDVTFVGDGWTNITITDQATGLSTIVRGARFPAGYTALPHIGRDWTVRTAYDAAQTKSFIAPFHLEVVDARNDPLFRKLLKEGGITTFSCGVSPGIGAATLAQFQTTFNTSNAAVWPFLDANPEFDVYMVWDGIARTRDDARASAVSNPEAAAAYQWVLEQWKTKAKGFGITMIDEVVGPFQFDPTPTDGRWDHFTATAGIAITQVTDNTHIQVAGQDFSTLPFPAQQVGAPLMKPRVYIKSGAHAGKLVRVTSGDALGNLVLENHDELGNPARLDLANNSLAVGDLILISGWWSNPDIPLPDTAITDINAKIDGGAYDIPYTYAPAAHVPGWCMALWFEVSKFADIYTTLPPDNGMSVQPQGAPAPQARDGFDYGWYDTLDKIPPQPLVALTGATGYYYTKTTNEPKGYYDPMTDISHAAGQDALYSGYRTALSFVEFACGTRPYLFDTYEQRQGRIRETYPRTLYGEPLQTGFHPYARGSGSERFWAIAAVKRMMDQLNAKIFGLPGEAPSIAQGVRTSYRASAQGRVLMAVNTYDTERSGVLTLGARWYAGGKATRWRQRDQMSWTEHVAADGQTHEFLGAEFCVYELHTAADAARPAAKWKFPFEPAYSSGNIPFRIETDAAVPVANVKFYVDGDLQATVNAVDGDGLWSWTWDSDAWTADYTNYPRRNVWIPIKAVVTAVNGSVAEIRNSVMLAPGFVAEPPTIVMDGLVGLYGADELVTVEPDDDLIVWESITPPTAIDIPAGANKIKLATHSDGLPELVSDGTLDFRTTHGGGHNTGDVFIVCRKAAGNFDNDRALFGHDEGAIVGVPGTENLVSTMTSPAVIRVDGAVTNAFPGAGYHILNITQASTPNTLNRVLFGGRPWEGQTSWNGAVRAYAFYNRVLTADERAEVLAYLSDRFLP